MLMLAGLLLLFGFVLMPIGLVVHRRDALMGRLVLWVGVLFFFVALLLMMLVALHTLAVGF